MTESQVIEGHLHLCWYRRYLLSLFSLSFVCALMHCWLHCCILVLRQLGTDDHSSRMKSELICGSLSVHCSIQKRSSMASVSAFPPHAASAEPEETEQPKLPAAVKLCVRSCTCLVLPPGAPARRADITSASNPGKRPLSANAFKKC